MKLKVSLTRSIKGGNCHPETGSEWSGAMWRDSGSLGVGAVNWQRELSAWRWVLLWPHSLPWLCMEKAELALLLMALCRVRGTGLLKEWVREWLWCLAMEFKLGDRPEGPSSERDSENRGSQGDVLRHPIPASYHSWLQLHEHFPSKLKKRGILSLAVEKVLPIGQETEREKGRTQVAKLPPFKHMVLKSQRVRMIRIKVMNEIKWCSDPIPEILIHLVKSKELVFNTPCKIQSSSWLENLSSKSSQLRSFMTASNYLDATN